MSTTLSISERVRLASRILTHQRAAIVNGDGKVTALFAFQTGGIALLTTKFDQLIQIFHSHRLDGWLVLLFLLLVGFTVFALRSLVYSFRTLHPHVKNDYKSLMFFGTIPADRTEFKEAFSNLTQEQLEDDLAANIVATAQIARRKHRFVQHAIQSFVVAIGMEVALFVAMGIVAA